MKEILVPIDKPDDARRAADRAIALYRQEPAQIHLLNVQRPLPRHVSRFFRGSDLRDFHRDAGMSVLDPAIRMLDEAQVPHQDHVLVGPPARLIVDFAEEHHCGEVLLEALPAGPLGRLGIGSIGHQVRLLLEHGHPAESPASGASGTT